MLSKMKKIDIMLKLYPHWNLFYLPPRQTIRCAIDTILLNTRVIGKTKNNSTTTGKLMVKFIVFIRVAHISLHIFEYLLNDILKGFCFCPLPRRN